jgi:hypothetical protein
MSYKNITKQPNKKTLQALYLQEWAERTFQNDAIVALNTASGKTHKPHPSSIIQRTN